MSRSQSQIGQSTWADTPFTLEKNPGQPMARYTPVVLDGSGAVIPLSAFSSGNEQVYQIRANTMTILINLSGQFPALTDTSFISMSLPPFVSDVQMGSGTELFSCAFYQAFGGAGFLMCQAAMFDAYLFVDFYPVFSVDAITGAILSVPNDFEVDPVFFNISAQVTFQFES